MSPFVVRRLIGAAAIVSVLTLFPTSARGQTPRPTAPAARLADPTWDGAVIGALAGAGAKAGVVAVGYAHCDAGCEAPSQGPMFAIAMGMGAAGGAGVGWIVDKLHRPKGRSPVAVAIRADREARAVRVQWRF